MRPLLSSDQANSDKKRPSLLRASSAVSGATMISRVMGLVRDVILARLIGAGVGADAFYVAFKLPNFFRRLFAEGAFNTAFVPVLSDYRHHRTHAEVKGLVDRTFGALGLCLALITVLVVLLAPQVMAIYGMGFLDEPQKFAMASDMLRITFPYLLLISLTGFAGSILNSYDRFAIPAITPVFLNISLILAALVAAPYFEQPVFALAWGVFLAGVVQFLFQLPFLSRLHLLPSPLLDLKDPGVRRIFKLMLPAMFGVSVGQINLLLDTILATFLPTGSVSWLYYSDRLMELPLGVFGVAIATVALPNLSRQKFADDPRQFANMMQWAINLVVLIGLPAALALIVLAKPILTTLFQYGEMAPADVAMATFSLMAYAIGLVAFMLVKILATGYFAHEDTKTPVKIGIIAMVANMVFNLVLVLWFHYAWQIGHAGLALATSLSGLLNAGLLYRGLRTRGAVPPLREMALFMLRIALGLVLMIATLWILKMAWPVWTDWTALGRVWRLCIICVCGAAAYFSGLWISGMRLAHLSMASAVAPTTGRS